MTAPVATIDQLTVTLKTRESRRSVLRDVHLTIAPGEILGLVGESGSGKSMLALALLGLLPAAAHPQVQGRALIGDVDMLHGSAADIRTARRRKLGAIFQDPMTSLNPTMRVGRQVDEVTGGDRAESVRLLSEVGIPDPQARFRVYPHELSGGLRQRVMAAIALAGSPSLIIADEPTTALDVTVQAQVLDLLSSLRVEFGCSVLFITHDLAVAAKITDRIGVMYAGRLVEVGPSQQILTEPTHPYTAGLLRSRLSLRTPRDGMLPTLAASGTGDELLRGCAYRGRCPLAFERCVDEDPPLEARDVTTSAACWREPQRVRTLTAAPLAPLTTAAQTSTITHSPIVVRLDALTCTYGRSTKWAPRTPAPAVKDVSLQIARGEALSIVGESGSGKSTVLRAVAGLLQPTSGSVIVTGRPQMVFQDAGSSLTPWRTVRQLLTERMKPLRLGREEQERRLMVTLTSVGLSLEIAARRPSQLSGGQRQRVALARATIIPPAVLLCDEPTSALDASLAAGVLNLIRGLRSDLDMAVLFVTHDLSVARLMGDRIAVMYRGEVVEVGPSEQIIDRPEHPYTRSLLGAVPEIAARMPPAAAVTVSRAL